MTWVLPKGDDLFFTKIKYSQQVSVSFFLQLKKIYSKRLLFLDFVHILGTCWAMWRWCSWTLRWRTSPAYPSPGGSTGTSTTKDKDPQSTRRRWWRSWQWCRGTSRPSSHWPWWVHGASLERELCKFMIPDRLCLFALFICSCCRAFKMYYGLSINSHNVSWHSFLSTVALLLVFGSELKMSASIFFVCFLHK